MAHFAAAAWSTRSRKSHVPCRFAAETPSRFRVRSTSAEGTAAAAAPNIASSGTWNGDDFKTLRRRRPSASRDAADAAYDEADVHYEGAGTIDRLS
jgi:hypothetical protein